MSERRRRRTPRTSATQPQHGLAYLVPPDQVWRLPLDAMMLGTMLFAAFAYGSAEPWSQQFVAGLALAMAVYTLVASFARPLGCGKVGSWTYLPIVLFVGFALLQTVPLPASLVQTLAPGIYETRTSLMPDLETEKGTMTLSLLPAATLRQLWPLAPVIAVFLVALHAYRSGGGVRRLCEIMMLCAAAVACYALYQNLAGIRGHFEGWSEHPNSGPFLNHSHFGQYVNLGIGAAMGIVLYRVNRLFKEHRDVADVMAVISKDRRSFSIWLGMTIIIVGAIAILLSMTRGGVLSMLIAGGLVAFLMTWRSSKVGSAEATGKGGDNAALLVGMGVVIVAIALAVGFDQIYDRLSTLGDLKTAQGGRLQILSDIAPAVAANPIFGTGLGTFEVVFPRYDSDAIPYLTTHAENEYAQLLFETGSVGLLCMLAFLGIIFASAWRVMQCPSRSMDYLVFGLVFGLVAILLHSLSDFGQHVPAVAMMTALTAASILNLAALHHARPEEAHGLSPVGSSQLAEIEAAAADAGPRWLRYGGPVLLAGVVLFCGVAAVALEGPRKARVEYANALNLEDRIYGNDADLIRPGDDERLIRRLDAAAKLDPSEPNYAYQRDYYTWGLLAYDENGEEINIADDPETLAEIQNLLDRVNQSRRHAPTFGPLHQLAGEIRWMGLNDLQQGAQLISLGHDLTPHDPYAAFAAGNAMARLEKYDQARKHFEHAIKLNSSMRKSVVEVYALNLNDPAAAHELAGENIDALRHLRRLIQHDPQQQARLEQIDKEVRKILLDRAYADQPRANDLAAMAEIYRRDGEIDDSITMYRRAIALNPSNIQWRIQLGRIYADQGKAREAVREARAALQIRPDSRGAEQLLQEQVVRLSTQETQHSTE